MNVDNNPKTSAGFEFTSSINYADWFQESLIEAFEIPKLDLFILKPTDPTSFEIKSIKYISPPRPSEYGYNLYETLVGTNIYNVVKEIIKTEMTAPAKRKGQSLYKKEWLMCGSIHPALAARIVLPGLLEEGPFAWEKLLDYWNLREETVKPPRTLTEVIYWLRQYPEIPLPGIEDANTLDRILGHLNSVPPQVFIERSLCCESKAMTLDDKLVQIILDRQYLSDKEQDERQGKPQGVRQGEHRDKLLLQIIMWGEFLTEAQFESIWNSYNVNPASKESQDLLSTLILYLPPRLLLTKTDPLQRQILVNEQEIRRLTQGLPTSLDSKATTIQKGLSYAMLYKHHILTKDIRDENDEDYQYSYPIGRRAFIKLWPLFSTDFMMETIFGAFIDLSDIPIENSIIASTIEITKKRKTDQNAQFLIIQCGNRDKICRFFPPDAFGYIMKVDSSDYHIMSGNGSIDKVIKAKKGFLTDVRAGPAKIVADGVFNIKLNYLMSQLPRMDSRSAEVSEIKKLLYTPQFFKSIAERFAPYPYGQMPLRNTIISFLNHAIASGDGNIVRAYLLRVISKENASYIKPILKKHQIDIDPAELDWLILVNSNYLQPTSQWRQRGGNLSKELCLNDLPRLMTLIDKYDYYLEFILIFIDLLDVENPDVAPAFFRFLTETTNNRKIPSVKDPEAFRDRTTSNLDYLNLIKLKLTRKMSTTWTIKEVVNAVEPGEQLLMLMSAVCDNSVAIGLSSQQELQEWMCNILARPGGNQAFWTEAYRLFKIMSQKVLVWAQSEIAPEPKARKHQKGSKGRVQRNNPAPQKPQQQPDFFAKEWLRFEERISTADSQAQVLKALRKAKKLDIRTNETSNKNSVVRACNTQWKHIQSKMESKEKKLQLPELQSSDSPTRRYLESKIGQLQQLQAELKKEQSRLIEKIVEESKIQLKQVSESSSIKNDRQLTDHLKLIQPESVNSIKEQLRRFTNEQTSQYKLFVDEKKALKFREIKLKEHLEKAEPPSLFAPYSKLLATCQDREAALWSERADALRKQSLGGMDHVEIVYEERRGSLEAYFKSQITQMDPPSVDKRAVKMLEYQTKKFEESQVEIAALKAKLAQKKAKMKLLKSQLAELDASSSSESSPPEDLPGTDMEALRVRLIGVLTPISNGQGAHAADAKAILKAVDRHGNILKQVKKLKSILERSGFTLNTDNGGSHRSTKSGSTALTLAAHSSQSKPEHKKDFLEALLKVVEGWK